MSVAALSPRQAFLLGIRALLPMHLGVVPFGVIYGVIAVQSGMSPFAAVLMSSVVFAGSAQFVLAQLVGAGAPMMLSVATVGVVNLRHALYSASVAPLLPRMSRRWKVLLAYLLTDEAYAAAIPHLMAAPRAASGKWLLFGSGFALWAGWQLATVVGVILGSGLPDYLGLDFALPLTFIAIVVPMLTNRARIAAALCATVAAVVLAGLPWKLGMVVSAMLAIIIGGAMSKGMKDA